MVNYIVLRWIELGGRPLKGAPTLTYAGLTWHGAGRERQFDWKTYRTDSYSQ